jgi:hydrogenase maturation protease
MSGESKTRALFAGIGSPHGDDRIGWLVADRLGKLERLTLLDIEVRQASTPSHLLDWLDGFDRLVICDACLPSRSQAAAGADSPRLHRWTWPTLKVSSLRSAGSHAFGLPMVLQLAERLGTLPIEVIVFGVEGERFDAFSELSPCVSKSFGLIVETIAAELFGDSSHSAGYTNHSEAASHA